MSTAASSSAVHGASGDRLALEEVAAFLARRETVLARGGSKQLDAYLGTREIRRAEQARVGLTQAVEKAADRINVFALTASDVELLKDFKAAGKIERSTLFRLAGREGMYTLGSDAVHLIGVDVAMRTTSPDHVALAKYMMALADQISCGVVFGAHPSSLGSPTWSAVKAGEVDDVTKFYAKNPQTTAWLSVRKDSKSRHLAVVGPDYVARTAWTPEGNASDVDWYVERQAEPLLCNAMYLPVLLMADAYARHNWPAACLGEKNGGAVSGLPVTVLGNPKAIVGPLAAALDQLVAKSMVDAGFVPIQQYADGSMVVVTKMPSVYLPPTLTDKTKQSDLRVNAEFNLTVSTHQIGHLVRDYVQPMLGDDIDFESLNETLTAWIGRIVLVNKRGASEAMRKSMPLKSATIVVSPVPGRPDAAHILINVQPHIGLGGVVVDLKVTAPKDPLLLPTKD